MDREAAMGVVLRAASQQIVYLEDPTDYPSNESFRRGTAQAKEIREAIDALRNDGDEEENGDE